MIKSLRRLSAISAVVWLASLKVASGTVIYTYDDLGRVTSIVYDDGRQVSYTYDSAGNRIQDVTSVFNQLPVAVADSVTGVSPTVPVTINVRVNDSDPDNDPLTVVGTTTPAKGATNIVSNNVVYTANAGTTGADNFTYTISDGRGGSASAAVNVTISGTNHLPVAVNDTGYVLGTSNAEMVITLDPRVNDSDPDGNPLVVTAVTNGTNGSVTIQGGGTSVFYQRTSLFPTQTNPVRTDSFTYTISDGQGGTATATVNVTLEKETQPMCGGVPC